MPHGVRRSPTLELFGFRTGTTLALRSGVIVPDATPADRHRCSVLVVDDDADIRELLRVSLSSNGYDVAAVADGREALQYLRSHVDTCMILLDLLLPAMDGAMFRAAQLRDRSLAWIPVVVMSGGVEAAVTARAFGARAFVRKPLDLDDVRRTLGTIECCRSHPRSDNRADNG
jgi:CheY-like chemotaxis protein